MLVNTLFHSSFFLDVMEEDYIDEIRGDNPAAFTRNRKITPYPLMLQMFNQKGRNQNAELVDFYKEINTNLDISTVGFYNARMKFNPEAIRHMSNDFISMVYMKEQGSMVKLNGYSVTAIDGSDFILPSTSENALKYGICTNQAKSSDNCPVMGKLSVIYDCINKVVFDTLVGEYKHSERDFASRHLKTLKEATDNQTITTFDRGYFSWRLVDQMVDDNQKFVFRMPKNKMKQYSDQVESGEDKTFNITFDRLQSNDYRDDKQFRMKLMNTEYQLRIIKTPISSNETGEYYDEIIVTNLSVDEFDMGAIKELYRLRWEVETAYNVLKNKMKIEEFSGYRERLILQDIYTCVWLYNIVMLQIIEVNEEYEIPQDRYKYEMKRNVNVSIGIIKSHFVKSVINDRVERGNQIRIVGELINKHLVPIRPDRNYKRPTSTKNKSRMSYRYSY